MYTAGRRSVPVVEPRLRYDLQVSPAVRMFNTLGLVRQRPSFPVPLPALRPDLSNGLQRAVQHSFGAELRLDRMLLRSTFFQNAFFNYTDLLSAESDAGTERLDGKSFGGEFLLRYRFRALTGIISYTLSRSLRWRGRVYGVAAFDRTHVFNAATRYDLGNSWRLASRLLFYTGVPEEDIGHARSVRRTRPFFRLDWRLEKRWSGHRPGTHWALVFELLNTMLQKESVSIQCDDECRESMIGPIFLPSIGLEATL